MTDSSAPRRRAVNSQPTDPWREMSVDNRDNSSPDDDAERDRWLRDNIPPHHG